MSIITSARSARDILKTSAAAAGGAAGTGAAAGGTGSDAAALRSFLSGALSSRISRCFARATGFCSFFLSCSWSSWLSLLLALGEGVTGDGFN